MTTEDTTPTEETQDAPAGAPGAADATAEPGAGDAHASEEVHGEAWRDVLSQLDALGDAMSRWTRAAVNDPENRARAYEVKAHVEQMANKVSDAVGDAVETDIGQQIKDAAVKTGEALKAGATKVGDEVAPRMASAFRVAAEKLHQVAERMEKPAEAPEAETDGAGDDEVQASER